ncbi:putative Ig domain-containing protein [Aurantimicrobium sp. MWH-Uga1]|uniref:Npun_F0296 family exosortase-dependent surface protein n=1 Tax=Aurantimicrobium sp. MWH-Uga1 TaxID=2079575 RepID=UPI000DEDB632|nr:putative Ig domain-containing protein [Aurantimicrobium sp. MWH-Uga1]AXE53857.1 Putative Ig domain protein [Aurantimicrobium sp. MWH-Uga1]
MKKLLGLSLTAALCALVLSPVSASASNPTLNFYISPPTVQNTYVAGAEIATFNSYTTGACPTAWTSDTSTSIGTITTTGCSISGPNQYGGATTGAGGAALSRPSGNGTNYASVPSNKTVTLTLDQPESYLGFWWSAGDANNTVKLYSGGTSGTLVGTFTTASLVSLLNNGVGSITAIDNTSYQSCEYFGNPVLTTSRCGNLTNTEPFAYVHLIGANGLTFDTLVFSQGSSGGFEFDNMAIARNVNTPATSLISFPAELNAGNPSQVADTCTAFTSNFAWTASNFASSPSYAISPVLPAGLSLNTATGSISGTASAASSQANYTITATAGAQSASDVISLSVTDAGNLPCPTASPTPSSLPATGQTNSGAVPVALYFAAGLLLAGSVLVLRKKKISK